MMVAIREAEAGDADAVAQLWRACGLVVDYNDPHADFHFALDGAASTVLVAQGDAAIVGSVMVGHDGHRGWLYYVATAPDVQGQGVGRALVAAGEAWLRQRRVRKVQLMVRQTNSGVIAFYDRLGYIETPRVILSKWLEEGDADA